MARRLWSTIEYVIMIDSNESFSNAQIRGTDLFHWRFTHKGRIVDASFEPIKWLRRGRVQYRIRIDGLEIACETVVVRAFGCWCFLYSFLLVLLVLGLPGALIFAPLVF